MSLLLENKNALPFEAQKHCKLRLEEQKDIHDRFENGESIDEIHESYPFVSKTAIKYWAFNRDKDLQRRKESADYRYSGGSGIKDKQYYEELNQRRKDNGLEYHDPGNVGSRSLTGIKLNSEQKKEIMRLYETRNYSEIDIANKLNLPKTIVRSVFQSKEYKDQYKEIVAQKKEGKKEFFRYVYELSLQGFTGSEISQKVGFSEEYIRNIIYVARKPHQYINTSLANIARCFI